MPSSESTNHPHHQLTYIFLNVLRGELSEEEKEVVDSIQPYYEEAKYRPGEAVFVKNTHPDAFFIVLQGSVAVPSDRKGSTPLMIRSGAGTVQSTQSLSSSNLLRMDDGHHKRQVSVESFHQAGGIFGYCDFLLERYRTFDAVAASSDGATVAMFTRANMNAMKKDNPPVYAITQKLLLRASLMDLANCTCNN